MNMNDKNIRIGAFVVVILLILAILYTRRETSRYTAQVFEGMTAAQAAASFTEQTAKIVQELKQKLTEAIAAKNTPDQLVAISDQYSQYSCDLNKAFSRFQIKNMGAVMAAAPAPK